MHINRLPDLSYIHSRLVYNKKTGILAWKHSDKPAGCTTTVAKKYKVIQVRIDNTLYLVSRICYLLYIGKDPYPYQVDHIDRDPLNNIASNLRLATPSQNQFNRAGTNGFSSNYRGVCWNIKSQRWHANIKHKGYQRHLGYFHCEQDAAKAFHIAAIDTFKEFYTPADNVKAIL